MRNRFKIPIPLRVYPFLFAAYATINYFSYDLHKVPGYFLISLGVSWVITLFFALVLWIFYRDKEKLSLATFLLTLLFFSYGIIHDALLLQFSSAQNYPHHTFVITSLLILTALLVLIWKIKAVPASINIFLTIATVSTLLYAISVTGAQAYDDITGQQFSATQLTTLSASQKPDIYYLVFDDYGGNKALKDLFNFDNTPFFDQLHKRGFYTADLATTNYNGSQHSVASTLNLNYIDTLSKNTSAQADPVHFYQELIENNQVERDLQNSGYTSDHLGSWFEYSRFDHNANENFYPAHSFLGLPYYTILFLADTTLFEPIQSDYFSTIHRDFATYQLNQLPQIINQQPSPKFVFAHILLPHGPNVFTADCKQGDAGYIAQLQCTNTQILSVVDQIKAKSKTPPIIVLQTDEGSDAVGEDEDGDDWSDRAIEEKYPMLAAYDFPDGNYSALYPTMTPVNSFRIIFNQYLGAHLPLFPDKNYLMSDETQLKNPKDVTSIVQKIISGGEQPKQ